MVSETADWQEQHQQAVAEIDRVAALGERIETRTAHGSMVWRRWGDGEPLALLHGGYGSWMHWIRNVETLASRYRVYCADLPGLGESATVPEPYDGDSLGATVAASLRQLLEPGERCHVVGFSFGGVLSGPTARSLGEAARSITLVGSNGMGLPRASTEALRKVSADAPLEEAAAIHRRNLEILMLADPAAVDALALTIQMRNVASGRTKSRPISRTTVLRDALRATSLPVAGIWGELDATSRGRLHERQALLAELRPGTEWRTIAGAGHWVAFEAADAFNTALLDVLSRP